jgi:hypothetical protein
MSYDDSYLHDTVADTAAKHDAALDAARDAVVVTGFEFGECLAFKSDIEFQLFCQTVVDSDCPFMRAMVKVICADVIENKARQMVEARK